MKNEARSKPSISILGCGRLLWPLALSLKDKHQILASTTNRHKLIKLAQTGLRPFFFFLIEHSKYPAKILAQPGIEAFFHSENLIIGIPPSSNQITYTGHKTHAPIPHSEQIKSLIELLKRYQFKGRIYYCSSISVYGNSARTCGEQDTLLPETENAKETVRAEELLKHSPFSSTILRLGGLYSQERHPVRYLTGKEGLSDGGLPVNLIHQSEAVAIIEKILWENGHKKHEVYNLVNDIKIPKEKFYFLAAKLLNLEPPKYQTGASEGRRICNQKIVQRFSPDFSYWRIV